MQHESAKASGPTPLVSEVVCPNCWHRFPPERLLFVARHENLIGDDVAGSDAYRRFLPSRFNLAGDALDAHGMACQQLACPRCHLEIPRPLIEMPAMFLSIVGSPASGKSYFLAAMTWRLRSLGPKLGFSVTDGDPIANAELHRYEEQLFLNAQPDKLVALRKTELAGEALYRTVTLDGQAQTFPRPFQFTLQRQRPVTRDSDLSQLALVVYDNAGESFQPDADRTQSPVTLHLAESGAICFLFDPIQDPRFRKRCNPKDPQVKFGLRPDQPPPVTRQDIILNEVIARVRRYKGLSQSTRHRRPLIFILAKADLWLDDPRLLEDPLAPGDPARLDLDLVESISRKCRRIMLEACPEIVAAAEQFSVRVLYVPVSSLGGSPEPFDVGQPGAGGFGVRPDRLKPRWVTVPLLWSLSMTAPGLAMTHSTGHGGRTTPHGTPGARHG